VAEAHTAVAVVLELIMPEQVRLVVAEQCESFGDQVDHIQAQTPQTYSNNNKRINLW
jgi:hypothetical protein